MIDAEAITPVDASMIPTGRLMPVADTPFDFRQPQAIGARIAEDHEQLKLGGGYDHNFVVNEGETTEPALIARAVDPASGRVLEVFTTEPGVQLYTGNFLDGSLKGKAARGLQQARRLLPGDPALSRLAEPAGLPLHPARARRGVSLAHSLPLCGGALNRRTSGRHLRDLRVTQSILERRRARQTLNTAEAPQRPRYIPIRPGLGFV
jgi:hypothetical protein